MNKTQLQYAVGRLDQAFNEKSFAIRERYTDKSVVFDGKALLAGIKSGKIKFAEGGADTEIHRYTDISTIFDLPREPKKPKFDENRLKPLTTEYRRVLDQLYLGGSKEALAMIEAFVAKTF